MTGPEFTVADTVLRAMVAAACAYEVVAITTRRIPTISRIAHRYPATGVIVLAALARHFQPRILEETL